MVGCSSLQSSVVRLIEGRVRTCDSAKLALRKTTSASSALNLLIARTANGFFESTTGLLRLDPLLDMFKGIWDTPIFWRLRGILSVILD